MIPIAQSHSPTRTPESAAFWWSVGLQCPDRRAAGHPRSPAFAVAIRLPRIPSARR